MVSPRIKKRHPLKKKDALTFIALLNDFYDTSDLNIDVNSMEYLVTDQFSLILHKKLPVLVLQGERKYPHLSFILKHPPENRWVTVDMGAVPYVTKGADIMVPGIVEISDNLSKDDIVWVRDEKFKRPLAIGQMLMDGIALSSEKKGKGILNIHYIGDSIWEFIH